MAEPIKIDFLSQFNDFYFRNNRTTGQKSLRCFPSCCEGHGHVSAGFCGRSVTATLTFALSNEIPLDAIDWDEFLYCLEIHPSSRRSVVVESELNVKTLSQLCEGGHEDGNVMVGFALSRPQRSLGNDEEVTMKVVFNPDLHSWDYCWRSNRWSGKNETHVVDMVVLKQREGSLQHVLSQTSPEFHIMSSKKQHALKDKDDVDVPLSQSDKIISSGATAADISSRKSARKRTRRFSVVSAGDDDDDFEKSLELEFEGITSPSATTSARRAVKLPNVSRSSTTSRLTSKVSVVEAGSSSDESVEKEQSPTIGGSVEEDAAALSFFSQSVAHMLDASCYLFDVKRLAQDVRAPAIVHTAPAINAAFTHPLPAAVDKPIILPLKRAFQNDLAGQDVAQRHPTLRQLYPTSVYSFA